MPTVQREPKNRVCRPKLINSERPKMTNLQKSAVTLTLLALLSACCTAPHAPPTTPPRLPALELNAVGPAFLPRMQNFLQGKLPEPTNYALPLSGARLSTTPYAVP